MDNTINGRTPEEIKRRLGCLLSEEDRSCEDHTTCYSCLYRNEIYITDAECFELTLALIQQLENHIGELTEMVQQLERERDAAVEAQPKWISVEERLPGDPLDGVGDVVELLIDKGDVKEVLPGYYDHDEKDWVIYFGDILGDYRRKVFSWWRVIKWRPLPEPPKKET